MGLLRSAVARMAEARGYEIARTGAPAGDDPSAAQDFDPRLVATIEAVRPYTMTSVDRIATLVNATRHIVTNAIPGDIAECGVWRGGSMMTVARTLMEEGDLSRRLFLFDTFEGMAEPGPEDARVDGTPAQERYDRSEHPVSGSTWCRADFDAVRDAMASTGYPMAQVELVKGKVETTLPDRAPGQLALLRLDTDWYESTKHELEVLFHRVARHGIVIIDDYGSWVGARKAVDEFVKTLPEPVYLNRIDPTGRLIVVG